MKVKEWLKEKKERVGGMKQGKEKEDGEIKGGG